MAAGPACRSRCIEGMATETMKKSSTIMNVPVRVRASGTHLRRPASRPASVRAGPGEILTVMGPPSGRVPGPVDYPAGNGPGYRRRLSSPGMQTLMVGQQLRHWRERRRVSQLDLSLQAGISARHRSFVETGRSRPSSRLIVRLSEQLDVPLRQRNALLLAGGFAPAYPEHALDAPPLSAVTEAMRQVLQGHLPNPALAVDRHWELIDANDAVAGLLRGSAAHLLEPPVHVLRLSLHPDGMAPRIANLGQWPPHVLAPPRRQAAPAGDPFL